MKLMIASDLHGSSYWCARMLEAYKKEQPDRLIFLGDILYHGENVTGKSVNAAAVAPQRENPLCARQLRLRG